MMKKQVSLMLAAAMALLMTACGGTSTENTTTGGSDTSGAGTVETGAAEDAGSEAVAKEYTAKSLTVDIWDNNQLAGLQQIANEWSETSGVSVKINVVAWDDYSAAAKQITEAGAADGVYGTAMNTNDGQDGWYNFIYDFGGTLISDDSKTSGMDDPNTIAAMNYLAENIFPYMPPQSNMAETDPDVMFQSGIIGMMLQGSWMVNTFYQAENSSDYAWAEIPYYDANGNGTCEKEERVSLYNGLGWAAAADVEDPQAAYDLIAAFCSEAGQLEQSELGVTMAAYKGCSDAFISSFDDMDLSPFIEVEENGTLVQHPASKNTTQWEDAFTTGLITAWQDPSQMESVCRQLADEMNALLAAE